MPGKSPIFKYKPQTAVARGWDEIEEHYTKRLEGQYTTSFAELIKHIKSSGLSERLFAYTSMHKLVVSIYNPIEWNREALHIEFDQPTGMWYLKYYSKPFWPAEFERKYSIEKGIEKFDMFIRELKW